MKRNNGIQSPFLKGIAFCCSTQATAFVAAKFWLGVYNHLIGFMSENLAAMVTIGGYVLTVFGCLVGIIFWLER